MSKYTTEVRFICESYAGFSESQGQSSISKVIEKSREKVFDFDFPIYDESYRSVLETKILKHYYTREICSETVGLWKHFLDMKMNEIMPYYNKLYESAILDFNPFYDSDYTTKSDRGLKQDETTKNATQETNESHSTRTDDLRNSETENATRTDDLRNSDTESSTRTDDLRQQDTGTDQRTDNLKHNTTDTTDSTNKDLYSDTPQGALDNVQSGTYLTNARYVNGTDSMISNSTDTGTQTTTKQITTTNTGTQHNSRQRNAANTGTQKNDVSRSGSNTGTQKNDLNANRNIDENGTKAFTSTDDYLEHIAGKRGTASYSKMLIEYRETFINIDMMVIDDLSPLFFNLW